MRHRPVPHALAAENMSSYQQMYMQQQQQLASGGSAPAAPHEPVPLQAVFDYTATREEDLTVQAGQRIMGLEEKQGWWLAQAQDGAVGLVPANYVTRE